MAEAIGKLIGFLLGLSVVLWILGKIFNFFKGLVELFQGDGKDSANVSNAMLGIDEGENVLSFVYQDAKGNVSKRQVTNWTDDGVYIKGTCSTVGSLRTFRHDRIITWL